MKPYKTIKEVITPSKKPVQILHHLFSGVATAGGVIPAQSITAALRDLYASMDKGNTVPPVVLLQVLHMAFPRFAEKGEHGSFTQQDANECWTEMVRMLQQKLPAKEANGLPQVEKFK